MTKINSLKIAKLMFSHILYYSGIVTIYNYLLEKLSRSHGIKIISYHRVTDEQPDYLNIKIKVQNFEKQMKYLNKYYKIISLEHALGMLSKNIHIPPKTLVITFDDGYVDNFTNAFPILQQNRIPATIFLTVKLINSKERLWFEDIVYAIEKTTKEKIKLISYGMEDFSLYDIDQKVNAIAKIVYHLKTLDDHKREEIIRLILSDLNNGNNDTCGKTMLTWDNIREMSKYGISFGSHTMTHPILSRISEKCAEDELKESKDILENMLGEKIISFAYPNGKSRDFYECHIHMLKKLGYKCACTLIDGDNISANSDENHMFLLKRKGIYNEMSTNMSGNFSRSLFMTEMSGILNYVLLRKLRS